MADLAWCPTCADRDDRLEKLRDQKKTGGWRAKFIQLSTEQEQMTASSWALYTPEGAASRKRWRESSSMNGDD